MKIIEQECRKQEKKYIYAYDTEPDHTMHNFGPDSEEAKKLIQERNQKVEKLCQKLHDTIIFIVADHGHIKVDNISLKDYPELLNMLARPISIETHATSFKIKEGIDSQFEQKFKEQLGQFFNLYSKQEIISNKLFGPGKEHPLFNEAIGDYIAIAEDSNKALDSDSFSQHAGYTDDEIYVALIFKRLHQYSNLLIFKTSNRNNIHPIISLISILSSRS